MPLWEVQENQRESEEKDRERRVAWVTPRNRRYRKRGVKGEGEPDEEGAEPEEEKEEEEDEEEEGKRDDLIEVNVLAVPACGDEQRPAWVESQSGDGAAVRLQVDQHALSQHIPHDDSASRGRGRGSGRRGGGGRGEQGRGAGGRQWLRWERSEVGGDGLASLVSEVVQR